ncbi:MAG TPA: hypothetical protein VK722_00805 [Candidatus Aquilonibacter sp.]|jgi:hypothetical protein|nr:hypothetical protein [Candidatus Aquilonibacter sp.]
MPRLSVEDRIREAYVEMARQANYRPEAAEGSGAGSDVREEAACYARRFVAEEQTTDFHIGVSDYTTNRALVYTIEAARLLCCGLLGVDHALKLLEMAVTEVRTQRVNYPALPGQPQP